MTAKPTQAPSAVRADYTVPKVAEIFKCSPATVASWIKTGRIKAYRLGGNGHWRIPSPEVDRIRAEWTFKPETDF